MKKNFFGFALSAMLFALCVPAEAQQARIPRIGVLYGGSASANTGRHEAFRHGLRELGYLEGKTLSLNGGMRMEKLLPFSCSRPSCLKSDVIITAGPRVTYRQRSNFSSQGNLSW